MSYRSDRFSVSFLFSCSNEQNGLGIGVSRQRSVSSSHQPSLKKQKHFKLLLLMFDPRSSQGAVSFKKEKIGKK